jgi:chromosome segregation ATPase
MSKRQSRSLRSSGSEAKAAEPSVPREQFEDSKKQLYSALVLMARDRIAQAEARLLPRAQQGDSFWSQLETLLSRHEAQMEKLSQKASEMRSNLSASRKTASSAHLRRMDEARAELEDLQSEIRSATTAVQRDQTNFLLAQEQQLREQISAADSEIEELTQAVRALRKSSSQLKAKAQTQQAEFESKSKSLRGRTREAEARGKRLARDVDAAELEIRRTEAELEDLQHREVACLELYESLKQPLPVIQRIFAKR